MIEIHVVVMLVHLVNFLLNYSIVFRRMASLSLHVGLSGLRSFSIAQAFSDSFLADNQIFDWGKSLLSLLYGSDFLNRLHNFCRDGL